MTRTVAEVGREQNDFFPLEMARTGKSADVISYCNSRSRSGAATWAAKESAKIMSAYLPSTGLGKPLKAPVGRFASKLPPKTFDFSAGVDAAQGLLGADEGGATLGLPQLTNPDEVKVEMPHPSYDYETCLAEWDYTGATSPK